MTTGLCGTTLTNLIRPIASGGAAGWGVGAVTVMKRTAWVFLVLVLGGMAVYIGHGITGGSNIDARRAYWKEEIARASLMGADQTALERFAKEKGQALSCTTNHRREFECGFIDAASFGGTRRIPVRLAVLFTLEADKVIRLELAATQNFRN